VAAVLPPAGWMNVLAARLAEGGTNGGAKPNRYPRLAGRRTGPQDIWDLKPESKGGEFKPMLSAFGRQISRHLRNSHG
jgi:hypothetical protein